MTVKVHALPLDHDGPAFGEPWQATAFALAVHLFEGGAFRPDEWSAALGEEVGRAESLDPENKHYYARWLDALERLCREKGFVDRFEMLKRQEDWRRAYLRTPHGLPVTLASTDQSG